MKYDLTEYISELVDRGIFPRKYVEDMRQLDANRQHIALLFWRDDPGMSAKKMRAKCVQLVISQRSEPVGVDMLDLMQECRAEVCTRCASSLHTSETVETQLSLL